GVCRFRGRGARDSVFCVAAVVAGRCSADPALAGETGGGVCSAGGDFWSHPAPIDALIKSKITGSFRKFIPDLPDVVAARHSELQVADSWPLSAMTGCRALRSSLLTRPS